MQSIQVTLTVAESKVLLAHALKTDPRIKKALDEARICLFGGTTVSAFAETLGLPPLKLSGRVDKTGCRTALHSSDVTHNVLLEGGKSTRIDGKLEETVLQLNENDLIIIGANAFDAQGQAAIAFGSASGGPRGQAINAAFLQGIPMLIVCGLEKMVPSLTEAFLAAGRKTTYVAMGMAVGLYPLHGALFTEIEAFQTLFGLKAIVLISGGVFGGEGAKTFSLQGELDDLKAAWQFVRSIKGATTSAHAESIPACEPGCAGCQKHLSCGYLHKKKFS